MTVYSSHIDATFARIEAKLLANLLERPYKPPELYIFEEVELGNPHGYHELHVAYRGPASGWSEPYKKSGDVRYRCRIVKVPYPPETVSGSAEALEQQKKET